MFVSDVFVQIDTPIWFNDLPEKSKNQWLEQWRAQAKEAHDRMKEIREAINVKVEELRQATEYSGGSSYESARFTSDGRSGWAKLILFDAKEGNGANKCFLIRAAYMSRRGINFQVDEWFDANPSYWQPKILRYQASDPNVVVVNGTHYTIGDPPHTMKPKGSSGLGLGYAGARWNIKFKDGRIVVTHNLWYQGSIPEAYRGAMQDNAEFLSNAQYEKLMKADYGE